MIIILITIIRMIVNDNNNLPSIKVGLRSDVERAVNSKGRKLLTSTRMKSTVKRQCAYYRQVINTCSTMSNTVALIISNHECILESAVYYIILFDDTYQINRIFSRTFFLEVARGWRVRLFGCWQQQGPRQVRVAQRCHPRIVLIR